MTVSSHQSLQLICLSAVRFLLSRGPLPLPLSSPLLLFHTWNDVVDRSAAREISALANILPFVCSSEGHTGTEQAFAELQTDPNQSCVPLALSQNKEMCLARTPELVKSRDDHKRAVPAVSCRE